MKREKQVWIEIEVFFSQEPRVIRIFRSKANAMKAWKTQAGAGIGLMSYAMAVQGIRKQIWLRCKGECEICSSPVVEKSGHMHEKIHRGKGGEISLENSVFICPTCHARAHKDRNPRWKKSLDISE